ncbi:biotin-dependent carboxyltransferase family protein [Streptomyces sp. NBC_01506]|uniref:5-oxoprolinase subunit C family protein n=1 Tax=Streptomyces sp. NBC_01506 TaxID=2903887 RepID=UPI0038656710
MGTSTTVRRITVLRTGPLTTVQDPGRPGMASLGVSPSGAADPRSHALGNRLVRNPEDAATLETTFGGLSIRVHDTVLFAVTGAPVRATVDGRPVASNSPTYARAGQTLTLDAPTRGVRTYLAIAGGITVPPVLGSRSTDMLSGLGPVPVHEGDTLPLGPPSGLWPNVDVAPTAPISQAPTMTIRPGPRDDWFLPDAVETLTREAYRVSSNSNRVGVRLEGAPLLWRRDTQLPPEGMVTGALQVPPSGMPILFLADHPVTGGYPVIAVVTSQDLPVAAQLAPGTTVRFRLGLVRSIR